MYYIGIDLGTSAVKLLLMDETVFRCGSSFFVWKETKKNTTDVISLYSFFGVPGLKTIPYRYACGLHAGTGTDVCGTCDGHSGFFTGDRFL